MYRLKQLTLLFGDLVCLYAGLYLGVALRHWQWPAPERTLALLAGPLTLLFLAAVVILFVAGLYDVGRTKNSWTFFQKLLIGSGTWLAIGVLYFYANPRTIVTPKTTLALITASGWTLLALWRAVYNRFLARTIWQTNLVFAGYRGEVEELVNYLARQPEHGFAVAGLLLPTAETLPAALAAYPRAERLADLVSALGRYPNIIVIAPESANNELLLKDLYQALFRQASIASLEKFYEDIFGRVPAFTFSESYFVAHLKEQEKRVYDRLRILADYLVALLMGAVWLATLPLIALGVALTSRGPVFFRQERVGRGGRPFMLYKYRTMRALAPDGSAETAGPQFAQQGDTRITTVGRFLRRTRLDELPQFINILRGEMGLVGPRPERPEFVAELTKQMPYYQLRHLIKPGLTGWAQLHRAYYGTLEENLFKLQYDLYYIKNRSFLLDLAIVLRTFNILVRLAGR
ncbi:MAG: sugar transferase [Candidatus Magasanikbacteria bacterium]|nr:sugar transferase [Candidatus Magasanikbacteria bacterium]